MSEYTDLMRSNFNEENYESLLQTVDDLDIEMDRLKLVVELQGKVVEIARRGFPIVHRELRDSLAALDAQEKP